MGKPKLRMPKLKAPKPKVPKVKAPKLKAPKPKAPKIKAPKPKVPKVKAPKIKAPKPKAPKIKAPKPKAPKVKTSKPKAPKIKAQKPVNPVMAAASAAPKRAGKIGSGERAHLDVKKRLERAGKARGQKKLDADIKKPKPKPGKAKKKPAKVSKPRNPFSKTSFRAKYKAEIAARHKIMKPRKLTKPLIQAINKLVEKNGEWGGGIDFEYDTHLPERMHLKHGRLFVNKAGQFAGVMADVKETYNYELRFHTHPYGSYQSTSAPFRSLNWQLNNKIPSDGDIWQATLYQPHLIVTKDVRARPVYVLITSTNEDHIPLAKIKNIYETASIGGMTPSNLRYWLNRNGFDFRQINPNREKLYVRDSKGQLERAGDIIRRAKVPIEKENEV